MTEHFDEALNTLKQQGRLRTLKPLSGRNGCRVIYGGREMLNLTSNDYLGLAGSHELHRAFYHRLESSQILDEFGLGSASSRLLTGDSEALHLLEQDLTRAYGYPAALFFNSGYHANIGILPALLGKQDLILSDKLNHASIHDGMRLSSADHKRFRHCDYGHLDALLEQYRDQYKQVVIVSESVFSMDGDEADLQQLVQLKKKYDCLLYVDEAHSVGLYGENGLGKGEEHQLLQDIDLLVGTFGKALASVGAFVLCTTDIQEYLVNHSRSLIFTTALPPVTINWNRFIFQHMLQMQAEREHLRALSEKLRQSLRENQLQTDGSTNIVPVMIGDNSKAVALSERMQDMGYLIFPIRPPAVPEGTSRFRLSLTADMHWRDIDSVAEKIASCAASTAPRL